MGSREQDVKQSSSPVSEKIVQNIKIIFAF